MQAEANFYSISYNYKNPCTYEVKSEFQEDDVCKNIEDLLLSDQRKIGLRGLRELVGKPSNMHQLRKTERHVQA